MNMRDSIAVSFTLTNKGKIAGAEVVQLYLHNKRASVVMPVKALKDFQKIMLQPGESKKIKFNINKEKLSFYNANLKWDAEPTDFDLMIGSSSEDIRLKESFELKK
jgi:beta-glucosidase